MVCKWHISPFHDTTMKTIHSKTTSSQETRLQKNCMPFCMIKKVSSNLEKPALPVLKITLGGCMLNSKPQAQLWISFGKICLKPLQIMHTVSWIRKTMARQWNAFGTAALLFILGELRSVISYMNQFSLELI